MGRNLIQKKETDFDGWGCTRCDWRCSNNLDRDVPNLDLIKGAFDIHFCRFWGPRREINSRKDKQTSTQQKKRYA